MQENDIFSGVCTRFMHVGLTLPCLKKAKTLGSKNSQKQVFKNRKQKLLPSGL